LALFGEATMTDYSTMSVHDLVCEALALQERERLMGDREPFTDWMQQEIEDALRKAVIRESSVGEISIEQHEGYMSPDPLFTVGAKSTLKAGEFYIVPKEKV
jgi:hypothetical protein